MSAVASRIDFTPPTRTEQSPDHVEARLPRRPSRGWVPVALLALVASIGLLGPVSSTLQIADELERTLPEPPPIPEEVAPCTWADQARSILCIHHPLRGADADALVFDHAARSLMAWHLSETFLLDGVEIVDSSDAIALDGAVWSAVADDITDEQHAILVRILSVQGQPEVGFETSTLHVPLLAQEPGPLVERWVFREAPEAGEPVGRPVHASVLAEVAPVVQRDLRTIRPIVDRMEERRRRVLSSRSSNTWSEAWDAWRVRLEQPGRYRRWAAVLGLAVLLTLLGALASALWYFLAPAIPVRADLHRLRLGRREYTWEEIEELQVDGEGVSVRLTSGAEHSTPRGRTDSAFRGAMHTVWSAVQERYHDVEEEDLEAREAVQALRASEVRTRARRPSKA